MATVVIVTEEFEKWYFGLSDIDTESVTRVVDLLEIRGVSLASPYSSAIKGAPFRLRELRIQSRGNPVRIFYAFDPTRQAVLLLGGDKTGDDRFYDTYVPRAEKVWNKYLTSLAMNKKGSV